MTAADSSKSRPADLLNNFPCFLVLPMALRAVELVNA